MIQLTQIDITERSGADLSTQSVLVSYPKLHLGATVLMIMYAFVVVHDHDFPSGQMAISGHSGALRVLYKQLVWLLMRPTV